MFIFAMAVAAAVSQGISIGLLVPVLDVIQQGRPVETGPWRAIVWIYDVLGVPVALPTLLLGVFGMVLLSQVLLYMQRSAGASIAEEFVRTVRSQAFDAFVESDLAFQHSVRVGTLFNGLTYDSMRSGGALESFLDVCTRATLLGIYAAMLLVVSWQATVVALGITLAATGLVQYNMRVSRHLGTSNLSLHNAMYGFIQERLAALRLMKLVNAEAEDRARFGEITDTVAALRQRVTTRSAQIRLVMEPSVAGAGLAAIYVGLQYFHLSLAQLAVFLYVLVRILPEAYGLNQARFIFAGMLPSHQNAIRLTARARAYRRIASGSRACPPLRQAIRFEHVSFAYEQRRRVVEDVTFTIEAGTVTAIVGPSGAGKSTLLDLLVRLVDPTQGRITFDGIDLREMDVRSLRQVVGLMTQDPVLFNGSVLENIRYGAVDADERYVIEAAVQADADDFIRRLPQGYHTVLGAMGMTLSGGERQRLALARVLLRRPSVLVLDEVTSGLDAESERLVQESIFRAARDRTVIFVTHRLTTIERANQVVVMDRGRIVEQGTPMILRDAQGLFKRLLELQLGFRTAPSPVTGGGLEPLEEVRREEPDL